MIRSSKRIRQVCMSEVLETFWGNAIRRRYNFVPYTDRDQPAVFYGCYTPKKHRSGRVRQDILRVENHRSLAVIVWCGSDSLAAAIPVTRYHYRNILHAPNVRHVAISKSVAEDLTKIGVPFAHVPLCSINVSPYVPVPLGPKVYVYTSFKVPEVYGWHLVEQVQARLPKVKFAVHTASPPHHLSRPELQRVYAECFIGLRLTPHDGLSNTVVELGLMGRRCVWNGWTPNAIPWTTVNDVVRAIKTERSRIGSSRPEVAAQVASYIDIGSDWRLTSSYKWDQSKKIATPLVTKKKRLRSKHKRQVRAAAKEKKARVQRRVKKKARKR